MGREIVRGDVPHSRHTPVVCYHLLPSYWVWLLLKIDGLCLTSCHVNAICHSLFLSSRRGIMPMTHLPEIGAENPSQKTRYHKLHVRRARNRYQFSGIPFIGADFWYVCHLSSALLFVACCTVQTATNTVRNTGKLPVFLTVFVAVCYRAALGQNFTVIVMRLWQPMVLG